MAKKAPSQLTALQFNGRERRKSPRVRYDVDTRLELSNEVLDLRLVDMSQGGCSFDSGSWQPEVGQRFDVKLALPACADWVSITIKICSRLGQKSGVEFVQMNGVDSSRLQRLLHAGDGDSGTPGFFSG